MRDYNVAKAGGHSQEMSFNEGTVVDMAVGDEAWSINLSICKRRCCESR